jgi:hypothetical protein
MTNQSLGIHILSEVKRTTLSYVIVGLDDIDFRQHDKYGPFPSKKDGKPTYLSRDRYMYAKLANWPAQMIDDIFSVFTDLMTSYEIENLKNIEFKNKKSQLEELEELEIRIQNIRAELGMPRLIEATDEPTKQEKKAAEEAEKEFEEELEAEVLKAQEEAQEDTEEAQEDTEEAQEEVVEIKPVAPRIVPPTQDHPKPKIEDVDPKVAQRARELAQIESAPVRVSDGKQVYVGMPSVSNETIEKKSQDKLDPKKIVIDAPPQGGRNPRFQPPPKI